MSHSIRSQVFFPRGLGKNNRPQIQTETARPDERLARDATLRTVKLLPMNALVISRLGDPDVLEVRQVADPVPAPGQELVRVEAGGVNFADIMTAQGGYPGAPKPPLVAGREFCGIRARDGQPVMGYVQWGAFAERVAAPQNCCGPCPRDGAAKKEQPSQ